MPFTRSHDDCCVIGCFSPQQHVGASLLQWVRRHHLKLTLAALGVSWCDCGRWVSESGARLTLVALAVRIVCNIIASVLMLEFARWLDWNKISDN